MWKKGIQTYVDKKLCVAAKVKQEYAREAPSIYGLRPVEKSDDLEAWVDRAHADRFILVLPTTWDTMLRADHSQNYNFMYYHTRK